MSQDQILSIVRWAIGIVGGYVVGKGWISSEQFVLVTGVIVAAVPLIWSIFAHLPSAQVNAVKNMDGIEKIIVNDQASPGVKAMAESKAPENAKVQESKISLTPKGKVA